MPCYERHQGVVDPFLCAACKFLTSDQLKSIIVPAAKSDEIASSFKTLYEWYECHLKSDLKFCDIRGKDKNWILNELERIK